MTYCTLHGPNAIQTDFRIVGSNQIVYHAMSSGFYFEQRRLLNCFLWVQFREIAELSWRTWHRRFLTIFILLVTILRSLYS